MRGLAKKTTIGRSSASFAPEVRNMQQVREAAIQNIIAVCPEYKEEAEHVLDEWAEVRGLDFHDYVPEKEVNEIIEILCAEIRLRAEIRIREEIIRRQA